MDISEIQAVYNKWQKAYLSGKYESLSLTHIKDEDHFQKLYWLMHAGYVLIMKNRAQYQIQIKLTKYEHLSFTSMILSAQLFLYAYFIKKCNTNYKTERDDETDKFLYNKIYSILDFIEYQIYYRYFASEFGTNKYNIWLTFNNPDYEKFVEYNESFNETEKLKIKLYDVLNLTCYKRKYDVGDFVEISDNPNVRFADVFSEYNINYANIKHIGKFYRVLRAHSYHNDKNYTRGIMAAKKCVLRECRNPQLFGDMDYYIRTTLYGFQYN